MFVRLNKMTVEEFLERYAHGELDFPGAHVERADLRDAYLDEVNLCGARLAGTDMRGAFLTGAYLSFITPWRKPAWRSLRAVPG